VIWYLCLCLGSQQAELLRQQQQQAAREASQRRVHQTVVDTLAQEFLQSPATRALLAPSTAVVVATMPADEAAAVACVKHVTATHPFPSVASVDMSRCLDASSFMSRAASAALSTLANQPGELCFTTLISVPTLAIRTFLRLRSSFSSGDAENEAKSIGSPLSPHMVPAAIWLLNKLHNLSPAERLLSTDPSLIPLAATTAQVHVHTISASKHVCMRVFILD
jgi:hypothetical protein